MNSQEENKEDVQRRGRLIRNTLMLTGVRIFASLCGLALTWIIAHREVNDLGAFRTLFVFFMVSESLLLLGMQAFLFREMALHPDQIRRYSLHALFFALGTSVIVGIGFFILGAFGSYSPVVSCGLYLLTLALPASALNMVALCILVALEKSATHALIQGLETVVRTIICLVLLWKGWSILSVMGIFVASRWLVQIIYWRAIAPHLGSGVWFWDRAFFREFISQVPTFAGIALLAIALRFAAPLILPWVSGDQAAGQFGAAVVFLDMVLLVPTAFVTNLMPRFAVYAKESLEVLGRACESSVEIMALGILPVVALIMLLAEPMMHLVYRSNPAYEASIPILKIAIWVCLFSAMDQVLSAAIVSCGKQKVDLKVLAVGAGALVVLLLFFIHLEGAIGAGKGLLGGTIVLVITRFYFVKKLLC